MAGWNTPARNAAINKRPCDQKTRSSLSDTGSPFWCTRESRQMAIFDYSAKAELSPTASEVALFHAGRWRMRRPTRIWTICPAPKTPSASRSRNCHVNFFWRSSRKWLRRDSTATEFAGCMRALNIRWPVAL